MAPPSARRPLPALAFLLGLSLLTALVWWRVIHRDDAASAKPATPTCTPANPNQAPAPSSVTIQVMNSTDKNGLAGSTGTAFTALGFKLAGVGNVTPLIPDVAVVKYDAANINAAKLVATYLPGSTLAVAAPAGGQVEVDLGAKFTALSNAADAAKALAAAKLTPAPASSTTVFCSTPSPVPTKAPTPSPAASSSS